jgi:hypothetical protein
MSVQVGFGAEVGCAHGTIASRFLKDWRRAERHVSKKSVVLTSAGGQGEHEIDLSLFWRKAWEGEDGEGSLKASCEGFYTRAFVMNKNI